MDSHEVFPRPNWRQAGLWMGANTSALVRMFARARCRVHPAYWCDAAVDFAFSLLNSGLGACQSACYRNRPAGAAIDRPPLFILGHWRTGTTLLHELLALDPRHAAPTTYQCFLPCHFLLTEQRLKPRIGFALPANRPPDAMRMGWDLPQEDEFALCLLGLPSLYTTIAFPRLGAQDLESLELDRLPPRTQRRWQSTFRDFVHAVERQQPGRLILKSPTHSFRIPTLLELFPDATFVYLVRHPYAVYHSTLRLWRSLFASHGYQQGDFPGLDTFVLELFRRLDQRMEATRPLVPSHRFLKLRYEDLVADPISQLERLYEALGLGPFEPARPAVQQYLDERSDHAARQYPADPGLEARLDRAWGDYFERHGYRRSTERAPGAAGNERRTGA